MFRVALQMGMRYWPIFRQNAKEFIRISVETSQVEMFLRPRQSALPIANFKTREAENHS